MVTSIIFFYLAAISTPNLAALINELTFCALYYIQPALQNQNKFLTFDPETNLDRRLVLYTCLSPSIVSGKVSLSCTTYPLKVHVTFLVKLLHIVCFHAKSKAFAFRLYFSSSSF